MTTPRKLSSVQVDVFTDRALTGNALAVFVMDVDSAPSRCKRWRAKPIFRKPLSSFPEIPLPKNRAALGCVSSPCRKSFLSPAIHARHRFCPARPVRRERGSARAERGNSPGALRGSARSASLRRNDPKNPEFGAVHDREAIALITGLTATDFDDAPIQTVSTGIPFTIVPVRSLKELQALHFDVDRAAEYLGQSGGKFFYLFPAKPSIPKPACMRACFSTMEKILRPVPPQDAVPPGRLPTALLRATNDPDRTRHGNAPSQQHFCPRGEA